MFRDLSREEVRKAVPAKEHCCPACSFELAGPSDKEAMQALAADLMFICVLCVVILAHVARPSSGMFCPNYVNATNKRDAAFSVYSYGCFPDK